MPGCGSCSQRSGSRPANSASTAGVASLLALSTTSTSHAQPGAVIAASEPSARVSEAARLRVQIATVISMCR